MLLLFVGDWLIYVLWLGVNCDIDVFDGVMFGVVVWCWIEWCFDLLIV